MRKDFDQMLKDVLDAEQQWKENADRTSRELKAAAFHHITMPDFEKFEEIERAQNQAPLDIVTELKAINERLDAEHDDRIKSEKERQHIEKARFWIAFIATFIGSIAAVGGLIATIVLR